YRGTSWKLRRPRRATKGPGPRLSEIVQNYGRETDCPRSELSRCISGSRYRKLRAWTSFSAVPLDVASVGRSNQQKQGSRKYQNYRRKRPLPRTLRSSFARNCSIAGSGLDYSEESSSRSRPRFSAEPSLPGRTGPLAKLS